MFAVVCFDICSDKRRRRVVKILNEHGWRIQHSVFEVRLRPEGFSKLKKRLQRVIKKRDRVHYYPLCGKDIATRMTDGKTEIHWHDDWFFV